VKVDGKGNKKTMTVKIDDYTRLVVTIEKAALSLVSKAKAVPGFSHKALGRNLLGYCELIERSLRGWQTLGIE
jgi:hypothetical protein